MHVERCNSHIKLAHLLFLNRVFSLRGLVDGKMWEGGGEGVGTSKGHNHDDLLSIRRPFSLLVLSVVRET